MVYEGANPARSDLGPASLAADPLPCPGPYPLRVLVVDEALPYPPDSGKRLRTWHLLRRLAERHRIELLCYAAPSDPGRAAAVAALAAIGIQCHTLPPPEARGWRLYLGLLGNCFSVWPYSVSKHHTRRFRSALRQLSATAAEGHGFDLVQVEWTPYASHIEAAAPPHLIASHNVEAQIWQRRAEVGGNPMARLFFHWQAAKMRSFERRAFRRARAVTTVSDSDRVEALRMGARYASIVANGVDLDYFRAAPEIPVVANRLLFLGALDWFPNQDAVVHFVDVVLPLIRILRPGATLQVVGRRPPAALRRRLAEQAGVELIGDVMDVRPLLAAAAVTVVPLRVGGGSRIKILESLAMEKPVVATTIGAEGLELRSGTHLLIADRPPEFARLTAQLLSAPELGAELARAGCRHVRARHNWDDGALALEAVWRIVASSQRDGVRP